MIWVDYVIVGIVAISTVFGLFRGFVRESISLATWIVAFIVSLRFAQLLAPHLSRWISDPGLRLAVSYAVLFVGTLLLGAVVNYLAGRLVAATRLTGTDRMLGMVFGAARGVAIVVLLLVAAGFTALPRSPWWGKSLLIGHMQPMAVWVSTRLPSDLAQRIRFGADSGVRS